MKTAQIRATVTGLFVEMAKRVSTYLNKKLTYFYHYLILKTPDELKWKYFFDKRFGEIAIIKLVEDSTEYARFNAETRIITIKGDNSSARVLAKEGVGIPDIQRYILSFLFNDTDLKKVSSKKFIVLTYERHYEKLSRSKGLGNDYLWHSLPNTEWLTCKKEVIAKLDAKNNEAIIGDTIYRDYVWTSTEEFREAVEEYERSQNLMKA